MWFYHTFREFGIERTNALNIAAIKSMAPIEMESMKRVLGIDKERFDTFDEFMDFILSALELTMPDSVFKKIHFNSPSRDIIHWDWEKWQCFAYKGMKQIGTIDRYRCGVMFRIECWLEAWELHILCNPGSKGVSCMKRAYVRGKFESFAMVKEQTDVEQKVFDDVLSNFMTFIGNAS